MDSYGSNYSNDNNPYASAQQTPPQPPESPINQPPKTPKQHKPVTGIKVFVLGFAGAAVACVLAFVLYGAFGTTGSSSSSVIGASSGTTFTVEGEDITLAEGVSQKVLPSVVNIDVYSNQKTTGFFGMQMQQEESSTATSLGSGVILSSDGYILTNYHVVEDGSRFVVVANATEYEAKVVGTDSSSDLAVLKIDASDLTPIEIGDSSSIKVGQWVMAAGSPYGLEQSVSTGIVSATSRSTILSDSSSNSMVYTNMIQTDAAINPGNSGGALVDKDGKLIGINTLIASDSGASSGVGFAIPVDYAIDIAQQIMDGKTPSHAQLGVSMATVDSQNAARYNLSVESGVYINSVAEGSGAEKAGLQAGDIITQFDGKKVTDSSELMVDVRSHKIGDKVKVTYVRDGEENTVEVTLGSDTDS